MRCSVPVRKALLAMAAILLVAGGAALAADTPRKGGVIRVGNLGEPPALDAHWTTASITETLTNHIYEGLYSLDERATSRSPCSRRAWPSARTASSTPSSSARA